MSALSSRIFGENAAKKTAKGAALAAMIFGSVAAPFNAANANDAAADIHPGISQTAYATQELALAKKSVGLRDSRQFDKDVVRSATAIASNDTIALALYGANSNDLNQARLGVWDAKREGIDVAGIVVGPQGEAKGYDVFGDGHLWAERTPEELAGSNDIRRSVYVSIKYADSSMKLLKAKAERDSDPVALASATYEN